VLVSATGPVLVGVLRDTTGGYQASFALLAMFYVAAAAVIVASGRVKPSHVGTDQ
jgi:cyanate permease